MATALATPRGDSIIERADTQAKTFSAEKYLVGNLTEEQVVDQIRRYKTEDEERLKNIMWTMLACYDQYRNKCDFSSKESWQSQITIAKAHAAVKHATANILKLLAQTSQPITVEDLAANSRFPMFFASDVERGILKLWEVATYREWLRDLLEGGFACGMGVGKVIWQYGERNHTSIGVDKGQPAIFTQTVLEGSLGLHSVDPWRFTFGPGTNGRYVDRCVETIPVDIPLLKEIGGFTNLDRLEKEDMSPDEQREQIRRRKDEWEPREHVRKEARLWEYWGDLIDEDSQEVVGKDMHILIANEKYIIKLQGEDISTAKRQMEPHPFWDKKKPYIVYSPLSVAFRFPGQGILEATLAIKDAIDEISQMQVDHLKFSLLNMFEIDMQMMENPEDIATGVEPGKFFRKRPGTGGQKMIQTVDMVPLTGDSFNAQLAFGKEYQRGTFITDQTQGQLDVKGETTATEVTTTQANTTLMLGDIALHIEDTLLTPVAERTWDRMFQFMDSMSNPSWSMVLGDYRGQFLDGLPIQDRIAIIQSNYRFSARGLSRALERAQNLQKLINYVQVIGQFGEMFIPMLNMPDIFRRIHESFHFEEPWRMLSPQAEQIMQQMAHNLMMGTNPAAASAAQAGAGLMDTAARQQGALDQTQLKAQNQGELELLKALLAQGGNGGNQTRSNQG